MTKTIITIAMILFGTNAWAHAWETPYQQQVQQIRAMERQLDTLNRSMQPQYTDNARNPHSDYIINGGR